MEQKIVLTKIVFFFFFNLVLMLCDTGIQKSGSIFNYFNTWSKQNISQRHTDPNARNVSLAVLAKSCYIFFQSHPPPMVIFVKI